MIRRTPFQPAHPNLVLIGYMASGKSTIGWRCARVLRYRFRDSDTLVERRADKPIRQIFEEEGEEAFRLMESEAIADLANSGSTVVATGGGAPLNPDNVARLRKTGVVILLNASVDTILTRCGSRQNRPLLAETDDPRGLIERMLEERLPVYRRAAHMEVDTTDLASEEAVQKVLAAYREVLVGFKV